MNKKFLFKKLKKWKRSLLTYLANNYRRQSEVSRFLSFEVKDAMKNACNGVATALEFILKLSHSFGLIH